MSEGSIGVDDLLHMLEQRGARLPFEIGAFLALEACEALMEAPASLTPGDIRVREDGVIHVRRTRPVSSEESARDVVLVLRRLLDAAGAGVPVRMAQLAAHGPASGRWEIGRVRDEIEAGLIPLNRSASRRVLSRMLRDAKKRSPLDVAPKAIETAIPPAALHRPSVVPDFSEDEEVDAALDALVSGHPPPSNERTSKYNKLPEGVIPRGPAVPQESLSSAGVGRPPPSLDDLDAELDALVRDDIARAPSSAPPVEAAAPSRPMPVDPVSADDDVDRLLEELPTSTRGAALDPEIERSARDATRPREKERKPVRVEPPREARSPETRSSEGRTSEPRPVSEPGSAARTEPRPLVEQARSGTRPAVAVRAAPPEDRTIEELMHAPTERDARPMAREAPTPREEAPRLPREDSKKTTREAYEATEKFQPGARDSVEPGASKGGRGFILFFMFLLLIGALVGGVAFLRPDVIDRILGRGSLADEEREALAQAEREAQRAREAADRRERFGDLVVTSTPDRAQVLMFVGRGPALATDLPKGVAHEFVAIADGRSPSRAIVAPDATWETTPEGLRYELAMQTGETAVAFSDLDLGATRLPANVGSPTNEMGSVRIVTAPPGAKVYQVIGFTPDVRVSNVQTSEAIELIVFAEGHAPERVFVGPSDWSERDGHKVAEINVTLRPRAAPEEQDGRRRER